MDIGENSLRKKKHQRESPGREGQQSSGDTRQSSKEKEGERGKSLEIEQRQRRSVEIQYGRESLDRDSADRDYSQETGEWEDGQKNVKMRERYSRESAERDSQDFGQKSRDWDSRELAVALAGQATALAGLEQKMERIIGQVKFYHNTNTNANTNMDTKIPILKYQNQ